MIPAIWKEEVQRRWGGDNRGGVETAGKAIDRRGAEKEPTVPQPKESE